MYDTIVTECNLCKAKFTIQDLIFNPELHPLGMIYDDTRHTAYYYYQHETPDCGTSFIIETELFKDYIEESTSSEKPTINNVCPRRCIMLKDLNACDNECYYAPFRRFLLHMADQKAKAKRSKTETPKIYE